MKHSDAITSLSVPDSCVNGARERMDPAFETNTMSKIEHLERYRFAIQRCGKKVLDIGCGVGYGSRSLLDSDKWIVGMDVAKDALQYARVRYPGPYHIRASGEYLPFLEETFDSVTAFEVLEHVPDATQFLKEVRRVLKPGGDLFVSTPNPRHLWNILRHWFRGVPYPEKIDINNPYHLKEFHFEEFTHLLAQEGFSIRTQFGQTIFMGPFNRLFDQFRLWRLQVYSAHYMPAWAVTVVAHAAKT